MGVVGGERERKRVHLKNAYMRRAEAIDRAAIWNGASDKGQVYMVDINKCPMEVESICVSVPACIAWGQLYK